MILHLFKALHSFKHPNIYTRKLITLIMFINLKSLLILIIIIISSSSSIHASSCNKKDALILLNIKKHFQNPPSTSSWTLSKDCCKHWLNVGCNGNGRIRSVDIFDSTVSVPVQIPDLITNLSALEDIRIRNDHNIIGPVPLFLSKLPHLKYIEFSSNSLTRNIPPSLCHIPNLYGINLSSNRLTGPIPDCLTSNFTFIDFSNNQISGSIPASLMSGANSSLLLYLYLSDNNLTGDIPRSIGDRDIYIINLSGNKLTGDASFMFGKNKMAYDINLSKNELEFDMSNVMFPTESLESVDLSHNRITGRIPEEIGEIPRLGVFDVSYNQLCGPIPDSVSRFDKSSFVHNKCLCGKPLPPCKRGCLVN